MWEVVAVMVPIVVSINALIFKRIEDLDRKLSVLPTSYISRDELGARFENIDYKLETINDRIEMTRDALTAEMQQHQQGLAWYAGRSIPRSSRQLDKP